MLVHLQKAQCPGSALHRALPGILQDKQHWTQQRTLGTSYVGQRLEEIFKWEILVRIGCQGGVTHAS